MIVFELTNVKLWTWLDIFLLL